RRCDFGVVERFRARGVEFFWLVHPSAQPADLGERLEAAGVPVVETATGMALELAGWQRPALPPRVTYGAVLDDADLLASHGLTAVLLERAREAGCSRVVLHSSEMAEGVYRRAGFVAHCRLPFHATTAVWSHDR